eukprot:362839-Chlamydomonas_euryale.AAC.3
MERHGGPHHQARLLHVCSQRTPQRHPAVACVHVPRDGLVLGVCVLQRLAGGFLMVCAHIPRDGLVLGVCILQRLAGGCLTLCAHIPRDGLALCVCALYLECDGV